MKLSDRLNAAVHPVFMRRVMKANDKKSKKVEKKHPELFRAVDGE